MLAGRFTKENSPFAIPLQPHGSDVHIYSIGVKGSRPLMRITWLVPVPEPPLSLVPEPLPSPRLSLCPGLVLYGPCTCALCRFPAWRTAGISGISLSARGHAAGEPASEQSLYFSFFLFTQTFTFSSPRSLRASWFFKKHSFFSISFFF